MYNKVLLIGNVGKEPELKKVSDTSYCTFSLATSESYKDKNGEWQNKSEWHNIVVWRNTAEYVARNIKKGNQIFVEGKIRTRSYEDKDTSKTVYVTEIVADTVKLLERRERVEIAAQDNEDDLPFS